MRSRYFSLEHIILPTLFTVVTIFATSAAFAGDADGGGSGKPPASFGIENYRAILSDSEVLGILGMSLEVLEIKLTNQKGSIRVYEVVADNSIRSNKCTFEVEVLNEHSTLAKDVQVVNLEILDGCTQPGNKKVTSTLTVFKTYFDKFSVFDESRLYTDYIRIAQDTPAEFRKRIINHMKTSNEKRYAALYEQKSDEMLKFLVSNPTITVGGFYSYLGKIMGLDTSQGVVIPVLVGLDIAPLFILNN